MNDDIVCLLQDLGRESAVEVIANFIIRNPDLEDLIAAKMGSILSADESPQEFTAQVTPGTTETSATDPNVPSPMSSYAPQTLISNLGQFIQGNTPKMILVVNMDLNMGRGKQCAQVAHAALGLYLKIQNSGDGDTQARMSQWLFIGQKKIVVKGKDVEHLKELQKQAEQANLATCLVADAGCTQIAPGSKTVLALFGSNEQLDRITGSLKLL